MNIRIANNDNINETEYININKYQVPVNIFDTKKECYIKHILDNTCVFYSRYEKYTGIRYNNDKILICYLSSHNELWKLSHIEQTYQMIKLIHLGYNMKIDEYKKLL